MKNIYTHLIRKPAKKEHHALVTILETRGSVPQVQGASAIFSETGLLAGTLGGGILEGDATQKAIKAIKSCSSGMYDFYLNADIESPEEAICGGSAFLLIDACPDRNREVFKAIEKSLQDAQPGVLQTTIKKQDGVKVKREWFEKSQGENSQEMKSCLDNRKCFYTSSQDGTSRFLEPIFPLPGLIIAGAGHIGKALAHLANLLDFEVTVIDDRAEYANSKNIPEADQLIVDDIGKAIQRARKSPDTYIVIVTRGHKDDAKALRACLDTNLAYIGMIGSKRKISLMREEFISKGWASESQLDRVHAPIGLEIGSKTIQEIAVSIAAQLVKLRHERQIQRKSPYVTAIILAAGESRRMGKPKLLLPFGKSSMIGTVIENVLGSEADKVIVVLGSNYESHEIAINDYPVEIVRNHRYGDGMLSSVQSGLRAVSEPTDAVMILLGDQPMIGKAEIDKLIRTYRHSEKDILVATHRKDRGHPLLFSIKYINEIINYPGQGSLKDFLINHAEEMQELETDNAGILRDIDTETDYQKELKNHHNHD